MERGEGVVCRVKAILQVFPWVSGPDLLTVLLIQGPAGQKHPIPGDLAHEQLVTFVKEFSLPYVISTLCDMIIADRDMGSLGVSANDL